MNRDPLILPVINYKGGTTKTTSAAFLGHAFCELGYDVLGVDADPQGSLLAWQEDTPEGRFPYPVVKLDSSSLHRQLMDIAGGRYDVIVIDTPPLELQSGIVTSAMRLARRAVVPLKATPIEYKRLAAVQAMAEDVAGLRADGAPVPLSLLFTRVKKGVRSTDAWREQAAAEGFAILKASVGDWELFSQAESENLINVLDTPYGDAAREILALEGITR
jgi:chromosome partitioning protein